MLHYQHLIRGSSQFCKKQNWKQEVSNNKNCIFQTGWWPTVNAKISNTSCLPKRPRQTEQNKIRLFLKKKSYPVSPICYFDKYFATSSPWKPMFYVKTERKKCQKILNMNCNHCLLMELNEPRHEISNKCGILTYIDSDEPVQPPFKLRNSKWCLASSLTVIEWTSKGSDQTVRMCRLVWAFAGRTNHTVGNLMSRLKFLLELPCNSAGIILIFCMLGNFHAFLSSAVFFQN